MPPAGRRPGKNLRAPRRRAHPAKQRVQWPVEHDTQIADSRSPQYGWRALVEADVSRWKRVIGDGLRSRTDGRQATEVSIAANVLNRMLDLGRPEYVRTA